MPCASDGFSLIDSYQRRLAREALIEIQGSKGISNSIFLLIGDIVQENSPPEVCKAFETNDLQPVFLSVELETDPLNSL